MLNCSKIRDLCANFVNIKRAEKIRISLQQISKLSKISRGKDVNQYVVIFGREEILSNILTQIAEFKPEFSKIVFTILPLGSKADLSKQMNTYKLKKYIKPNFFSSKNLHTTVGKIIFKLLQGEIQPLDVWKVGIECRSKGGIKKIFVDGNATREEYIMDFDQEKIRKAELKQKLAFEKNQ